MFFSTFLKSKCALHQLFVVVLAAQFTFVHAQDYVISTIEAFSKTDVPAQLSQNFNKRGDHIIVEFIGCENLDNFDEFEGVLRDAAISAGATILNVAKHHFTPHGMTGLVMLSESHIAIHTWPEDGYAAVDVFTCGSHVDLNEAIRVLKNFFRPATINIIKIDRGF